MDIKEQSRNAAIGLAAIGLVFVFSLGQARADLWVHDFGGYTTDYAVDVQETSDGGFLVFGFSHVRIHLASEPSSSYDFLAIRINASGAPVWSASLPAGGIGESYGAAMARRVDGGWMLAGRRFDWATEGPEQGLLVAIDAAGGPLYAEELDSDAGGQINSIVPTADGNFMTVGTTFVGVETRPELWATKVAPTGTVVWSYRYASLASELPGAFRPEEEGIAVVPTADGGTLLGGVVGSDNPHAKYATLNDTDIGLTKVDSDGRVVWSRTYGGPKREAITDIEQTADGAIFLLGRTVSFASPLHQAAWILKLDAQGGILWQQAVTMDGEFTDGTALAAAPDGGVVALFAGGRDAGVIRFGPLGDVLWAKIFRGVGGRALTRASNGDLVAALGMYNPDTASPDLRVIRFQEDGKTPDCLTEDLVFRRMDTTATGVIRRINRHAASIRVSNLAVGAIDLNDDLGIPCP